MTAHCEIFLMFYHVRSLIVVFSGSFLTMENSELVSFLAWFARYLGVIGKLCSVIVAHFILF